MIIMYRVYSKHLIIINSLRGDYIPLIDLSIKKLMEPPRSGHLELSTQWHLWIVSLLGENFKCDCTGGCMKLMLLRKFICHISSVNGYRIPCIHVGSVCTIMYSYMYYYSYLLLAVAV